MAGHNFPRHSGSTRTGGRYDYRHQQARRQAARTHHPLDPCTRCGHALGPMNSGLHYDHTDDGTAYLGFAHGNTPCPVCGHRCNPRAGAMAGNRTQHERRHGTPPPATWHSRHW